MSDLSHTEHVFDFAAHKLNALESYRTHRSKYVAFAAAIRDILRNIISNSSIPIVTISARAKSLDSFAKKAATPDYTNPQVPKYHDPLSQIEDLSAARIITLFLNDVREIDRLLTKHFVISHRSDKSEQLLQGGLVGYHSIHYVVELGSNRTALPEYATYKGLKSEVQLRTVLQHTWAEIEHDIQYKSSEDIPPPIRQRFANLAGLLAIADREFQSLKEEDQRIRRDTQSSVDRGELASVPITAESLKMYADKRLGEDNRIAAWNYSWTAKMLRKIGFADLAELRKAIGDLDDDALSKTVFGTRQGQLTRLETMLLVSMGDDYIDRHPFSDRKWWRDWKTALLSDARSAGLAVGSYKPRLNDDLEPHG